MQSTECWLVESSVWHHRYDVTNHISTTLSEQPLLSFLVRWNAWKYYPFFATEVDVYLVAFVNRLYCSFISFFSNFIFMSWCSLYFGLIYLEIRHLYTFIIYNRPIYFIIFITQIIGLNICNIMQVYNTNNVSFKNQKWN